MVRCGNCLNFKKAKVGVGGCQFDSAKDKNDATCEKYEPRRRPKNKAPFIKTLTGESILERCLPKRLTKRRC